MIELYDVKFNFELKDMGKIVKVTFLLLFTIYFVSCEDSVQPFSKNKATKIEALVTANLIEIKSIEFELDKKTNPKSLASYYFFDKVSRKPYYVYLNNFNNEIQFYCINNGIKEYSLKFDKVGPNGVSELLSFYVKTMDSIFLISKNYGTLYLVNNKSEILKKYEVFNLENQSSYNKLFMINILPGLPAVFFKKSIFCCVKPDFVNPWELSDEEKHKSKMMLEVGLETEEIKLLSRYYPSEVFSKGNSSATYSMAYSENRFVYSFPFNHDLFVTVDSVFIKKPAKSNYFAKFSFLKSEPGFTKYLKHRIENPRYLDIIYDPFRKVFYRFAYRGSVLKGDDDLFKKNSFPDQFSIIILDSDLNKIGEVLLDKDKYYHKMYFVSSEGLYISENNINNPDFDENKLKFKLFKLVKN